MLLFSGLIMKAQIPNNQISAPTWVFQKEIPKVISNADYLLTGERLHYKMHNLTEFGKPSLLSNISYVSLRDDNDSILFNHKLKLQNGSAYGSFFIPTTLKTGKYWLLCYTNFSLNNKQNAVAQRSVYIVNPFVKIESHSQKDTTLLAREVLIARAVKSSIDEFDTNGFLIKTDKPSYVKREKISISIENQNGKLEYGNYVISVRKLDPLVVPDPTPLKKVIKNGEENIFYIPELRGELISGKVVTADTNEPVPNKVVALSIPGKNYIFKNAKTDFHGRFFLSIDEPYETSNSIIQIDEPNREQYQIVLDKKVFKLKEKMKLPILKLDSNLKAWLEERSIQLQIENAYFAQDSTTVVEYELKPFYDDLGTAFDLDDYTRFPSLEETFVEVISLARIRKKNDVNFFEVFDPSDPYKTRQFGSTDPLLLLDGILVYDAADIFGYSAREIKNITVFPNTYRYGSKIYRGIIDFKTIRKNYKPSLEAPFIKEFELVKPLPQKAYATPNHSDKSYRRRPDYRTQLFWEPNVELSTEKLTRSFYASDISGTYQIIIEGYTFNGKNVIVQQQFVVE